MKDEYWYKLHEMVWSKEPYIMLGAIRRFMQNVSEKEKLECMIAQHQKNIDILREVKTDES